MKATGMKNNSLPTLLVGMLSNPSVLDDINVLGMALDSRQVQADWLFFSLTTDESQRLKYMQQALSLGAAVVLFDNDQQLTEQEESALVNSKAKAYPIKLLSNKVGEIAARFYGHPSLALTVIAITGTNGKTSVSQFIAQSLESLGYACGVIGTLGAGRIDDLNDTGMTTPDPVTLQAILADFCQQSIEYVVIEASSHALEQGRLNSVTLDMAVLTNLSRDHLDYHVDMAGYAAAKKQLFDFASVKTAVINQADDFGKILIPELEGRDDITLLTYSSHSATLMAAIQAKEIQTTIDGLHFNISSEFGSASIKSPLLGRFNVDNLLATLASLLALDISFEQVINALSECHAVDGRMQVYGGNKQPHVVIDFAHTPDALTQALQSLRCHIPANGVLWCVFGCGGDRDTGKRALMGHSAEINADKVVLTADNPRTEDNKDIVRDIATDITDLKKIHIEHDRQSAISYAVSNAKAKDIVLVAGKGHEQYQEIAGVKSPFSDAKAVTKALQAANDESHLITGVKR
ncbi:MAG: UDP-N-acetylmuramoyl-L-alanyl-D-glutamate--2,6-diaminopimelate ligase [Gammaproteobacteria bacterium]|nr:MAG: UDP-N-acetylmuramoyl-L-alanyl-D-glutamate--2,6-diaminopimelate ligase [Gammaproteobacteria bacterium]RKZ98538.1 MAG: UDP-N-acetylmuramoyl-L-alanyl-D-glutamate--2,6-diaminopimelate ligase [Gammaproteobacteria bacterium]